MSYQRSLWEKLKRGRKPMDWLRRLHKTKQKKLEKAHAL